MNINENATTAANNINGQQRDSAVEIQIPVPWGHISGKWWGSMDEEPLVAIHGWQDNAGTFDTLIPLLPSNLSILAIELPGHGYSSHFPLGQFYHIFWDGLLVLRRIIKHYKWNKVKLLGHSLGGAISFMYAAIYPDEVDFLISLDIVGPTVRDEKKVVAATADLIDKFLKYETLDIDSTPSYEYDELVDIVEFGYNGSLTKESAKILIKRGAQSTYEPKRYRFTRDCRLKVSLLGTMSLDMVLAFAEKITCGYLNIRAVSGLTADKSDIYEKVLDAVKVGARKFEYHKVEGTHHVHLNNPERVAPIINNFLST